MTEGIKSKVLYDRRHIKQLLPLIIAGGGGIWLVVSLLLHQAMDSFAKLSISWVVVTSILLLGVCKLGTNIKYAICVSFLLLNGIVFQSVLGEIDCSKLLKIYMIAPIIGLGGAVILLFGVNHVRSRRLIPVMIALVGILNGVMLIFGTEINGVRAWLSIGSFQFQITDLTKLLTIISWGFILKEPGIDEKEKVRNCFFSYAINAITLLIVSEFGSLIILTGTLLILIFLYVKNLKVFFISFSGFIVLAVLGIIFVQKISDRIEGWLNPEEHASDLGNHALRALKAIRLGGLFGDHRYLVEMYASESDFAFAALVNRLGTVVGLLLIFAFIFFFRFGFSEGNDKKSIIGNGLLISLFLSTILGIGGSINILPVVGVPTAFISYGGTNLAIVMGSVFFIGMIKAEKLEEIRYGMELKLGRQAELKKIRKGA